MPADFPSLQTASCQYVYKRYEELGDAMTAHVITYQGKSAAREVGNSRIPLDVYTQATTTNKRAHKAGLSR